MRFPRSRKMPIACLVALAVTVVFEALGQGTFRNLAFEEASIVPLGPGEPVQVLPGTATPGWSVSGQVLFYNAISIGAPMISIHDRDSTYGLPLQGNYSLLLQASQPGGTVIPFVSQVGLVPEWARSIVFMLAPPPHSTPFNFMANLGGQELTVQRVSTRLWGASVDDFAAQTLELKLGGSTWLDFVAFSPEPIPEPGTAVLVLLAGCILLLRPNRM